MKEKIDILGLSPEEMEDFLLSIGEKKFRAKQIFDWLHQKKVRTFAEMLNISKALKQKLEDSCFLPQITIRRSQKDADDGTLKLLYEFEDGEYAECVRMEYDYGSSICISSQVGCRMGCKFCASTLGGLTRHLSASEMLLQIYEMEREYGEVKSVVVMGMGEPFDNYDNVLRFLKNLTNPLGRNLGMRHITVSTCGLVKEIKAFAEEGLAVNLAISLHQTENKKRAAIMPIARKYDLDTLRDACNYYIQKTNRRISFEYALIENVTDTVEDAEQLITFCRGMLCHVNLIPINPVVERTQKAPEKNRQYAFKNKIEKAGIPVSLRRTLGKNIDAACGQLRKNEETKCK